MHLISGSALIWYVVSEYKWFLVMKMQLAVSGELLLISSYMWIICSLGYLWDVAALLAGNCMDIWALYLLKPSYINLLELPLCYLKILGIKVLKLCIIKIFNVLHSQRLNDYLVLFFTEEKFMPWCNLRFFFFFKTTKLKCSV